MSFFLRGNSSSRLQRRSYVVDPSKSIRDDYNRQLIDGSRRDFVCDGTDGEYSDNWIATKSLEWVRISQSKYKIQRRICTSNANNIHRNDGQHTYHAPGPDGSFKYRMSVVSDSSNCHRHPSTETTSDSSSWNIAVRTELYAIKIWNVAKLSRIQLARSGISTKTSLIKELRTIQNVLPLVDFVQVEQQSPFHQTIDVRFYHIINSGIGGGVDLLQGLLECHRRGVPFTEKKSRHIIRSLLQTLDVLHERHQIVHRNITPETIYLIPTMINNMASTSIYIVDFGLAKHVPPSALDDGGKETSGLVTRCGMPSFNCPPEMLVSNNIPYRQSLDMWSIGCLLYTLLYGHPPFQARATDLTTMFQSIRGADFTFPKTQLDRISTAAKQLIANLLTIKPNLRYTAKQALEQAAWFNNEIVTDKMLATHELSEAQEHLARNDRTKMMQSVQWSSSDKYWDPDNEFPIISTRDQSLPQERGKLMVHQLNDRPSNGFLPPTTPTFEEKKGDRFQDLYKLGDKIASGSTGAVYQCRHKRTGEIFAVKIARRVRGIDEYIMYEVALMRCLARHPQHIVKLCEFFEDRNFYYLILDYMSGGDVFQRLMEKGTFTEDETRQLAYNMLLGLERMHNEGIAHRDIKPQNLLLVSPNDDTSIKLSDFGFSRREHTPNSLVGTVGTPTYVAPEILLNDDDDSPYDKQCDLWSAGVTIYSLLCGYPPFQDDDSDRLYTQIREGQYEFDPNDWKTVSIEAKELIQNLLVVDPKQRWTAKDAIQCTWFKDIK